jgi:metal-responsive CopG/Arc/MetJ family transcriptional regulator
MDKTLTIRLDEAQNKSLTRRAKELGKTRSQLVREFIERGLEEQPLGRKVGHLRGILELTPPKDALRRRIKDRNWR